jgi:hypothetical protein
VREGTHFSSFTVASSKIFAQLRTMQQTTFGAKFAIVVFGEIAQFARKQSSSLEAVRSQHEKRRNLKKHKLCNIFQATTKQKYTH